MKDADEIELWDAEELDVWEVHLVYNRAHESPSDETMSIMAPDRETAIAEARRVSDSNPPLVGPVYNNGDQIPMPFLASNGDRFGGEQGE